MIPPWPNKNSKRRNVSRWKKTRRYNDRTAFFRTYEGEYTFPLTHRLFSFNECNSQGYNDMISSLPTLETLGIRCNPPLKCDDAADDDDDDEDNDDDDNYYDEYDDEKDDDASRSVEDNFFLVPLCLALPNLVHLKIMDLNGLFIGDEGMRVLSTGLQDNIAVTTIILCYNKLGDRGIQHFVEHWRRPNSPIEYLDLHNNRIGPVGAQLLVRAVATHPAMRYLNFDYNKTIGYEGLRLIGPELPFVPPGFELDLTDCIPRSECFYSATSLRIAATQAILDGVKASPNLKSIECDAFSEDDEITFYLTANEYGRYFFLSSSDEQPAANAGNDSLPPAVYCHLLANCTRRNLGRYRYASFMYLFLLDRPSLVQQRTTSRKRPREPEEVEEGDQNQIEDSSHVGSVDVESETWDYIDNDQMEVNDDEDNDDEDNDDEDNGDEDDDDDDASETLDDWEQHESECFYSDDEDDDDRITNGVLYSYSSILNDENAAKFQDHLESGVYPRNLAIFSNSGLTTKGAQVCATAIQQAQFTQLVVGEASPTDPEAMKIVLQAIRWVAMIHKLKFIMLQSDAIGCIGDIVKSIPMLASLLIADYGSLTTSIQSLSDALGRSYSLRVLNLTKGILGRDEMRMLSMGLRNSKSIKTLNLRRNQIDNDGIAAFVENWSLESPIEKLYLGQNLIKLEGAHLLVKTVAIHPAMKTLGLQGHTLMGYTGLEIFRDDVPSFGASEVAISRFRERSFHDDDVNVDGDDDSYERVQSQADGSDIYVIELKVRLNDSTSSQCYHAFQLRMDQIDELGDILSFIPSAETLHVCNHKEWGPSLQSLSVGLTVHNKLTVLHLNKAGLGDEGMVVLSAGLGHNLSIQSLSLCENEIGDEGLIVFLQNWCHDSVIQKIYLDNNRIGALGAQRLLRETANHTTVKTLSLRGNQQITYAGLKLIGDELPHVRLEELDISYTTNMLSDDEDYRNAAHALMQGIKQNIYLRVLKMTGGISYDDRFASDIYFYIALNCWGRHLLSQDHGMASSIWCDIFARACKDDYLHRSKYVTSLIYFFLREQPDLVQF